MAVDTLFHVSFRNSPGPLFALLHYCTYSEELSEPSERKRSKGRLSAWIVSLSTVICVTCPGSETANEPLTMQVPCHFVPQLQMEMLASGAPSALVVSRSATKVSMVTS